MAHVLDRKSGKSIFGSYALVRENFLYASMAAIATTKTTAITRSMFCSDRGGCGFSLVRTAVEVVISRLVGVAGEDTVLE